MKNKKAKPLEEYVDIKNDFKNQFQKKKQTQKDAKDRRQFIRELKEYREWN